MTFTFDTRSALPLVLGGNVFGWSADRQASFAVLDAFVEAGGTHIDTADAYSVWQPGSTGGDSETILGEWLASRANRTSVFLATKVGALPPLNNLAPDSIAKAVDGSLRRLQTDYIDLYWAHTDDEKTPQEDTLVAFDKLVKAGKVRHIGASNFSANRLQSALDTSEQYNLVRYEAVQPRYNLVDHLDFEQTAGKIALAENLAIVPYSSLASGFLTGKYRKGVPVESVRAESVTKHFTERGWQALQAATTLAEAHDVPVAAVALRWLADQDGVLGPIASARTPEQLAELLTFANLTLTQYELDTLRQASC